MSKKVNLTLNNSLGFSDEKLEELSEVQIKFEAGFATWIAWESENSSYGKTFREWGFYPKYFPLYVSADHGISCASKCWPHEISFPYSTYFTWHAKKNYKMINDHGKKSYHVQHPWVFYRKKHYNTLPENRLGTLVFYAHSNDTTIPVYDNFDKYINDLKSLPDKYQPIVICLSFHDIKKGIHKVLRKYEIPLVTAGTTNSQKFVDRFYSLIYKFRYTTSSNIGSHTYYILEAGIPFFLYGPYPEYQIKDSKYTNNGKRNYKDYGDEEDYDEFCAFKKMLYFPSDKVTNEQYEFISRYMGLNSNVTRVKISFILWRELFLQIDRALVNLAVRGKNYLLNMISKLKK